VSKSDDPAPARPFGQHAAQEDARGGAQAADRTPDAERGVAVPALAEGRREDRERRRRHQRRTEALRKPGADQQPLALRRAGGERTDREEREARCEHAPAAEQVRQSPAQQQEAAVGQQVAARHPLQALLREVQRALDRWKCDVGDRRIHDVEELDGAEQQQSEDAATGAQGHAGLRGELVSWLT